MKLNSWIELLSLEGIPLNASVTFQCHNENVRRVLLNGEQITISKDSREFAKDWIWSTRQEAFIVDTSRIDGYDWKKSVNITVNFSNGEPHGHAAFGNRKQRATTLQSIWGKRAMATD